MVREEVWYAIGLEKGFEMDARLHGRDGAAEARDRFNRLNQGESIETSSRGERRAELAMARLTIDEREAVWRATYASDGKRPERVLGSAPPEWWYGTPPEHLHPEVDDDLAPVVPIVRSEPGFRPERRKR